MSDLFDRRREWVNSEFGKQTSNTNMSNSKKTKLLKKLWKQAKREIPE